jgi:type IV secretory pathway VirB4 component
MAQVAALGVRRTQNPYRPKTPVHLFVDEATMLMAPPVFKILRQLRKENVFLTMAQQSFADGLDREMVKPLVDNTKVKMLGRSANLGTAFKALNWDARSIPKIGNRQFIVSTGDDAERLLLNTGSHLVDDSNAMDDAAWRDVLERQFSAYYRQSTPATSPAGDAGTLPAGAPPSPARKKTWRRE